MGIGWVPGAMKVKGCPEITRGYFAECINTDPMGDHEMLIMYIENIGSFSAKRSDTNLGEGRHKSKDLRARSVATNLIDIPDESIVGKSRTRSTTDGENPHYGTLTMSGKPMRKVEHQSRNGNG